MGTRQGEADVMERVHEVCWDTEQNEIEFSHANCRHSDRTAKFSSNWLQHMERGTHRYS